MTEVDDNISENEEKKYTDDQVQELADHIRTGDDSIKKVKSTKLRFYFRYTIKSDSRVGKVVNGD